MSDGIYNLEVSLRRYIGETVTIFTTSGGISGSGFTGVLIAVNCDFIKLITQIAAPPACPLGSACTGPVGGVGLGCGYGVGVSPYNWLGSVTEIPLHFISSFTHNAV